MEKTAQASNVNRLTAHLLTEYYENGKDIDIVTGNMEMDAIILLKEFEKKYPDFVNSLKNRLKSSGVS